MHIDRLEVKGFGRLTARTVSFKKGINILYGSNEAGKTTLQWFIKGMLYGLKSTRQAKNGQLQPAKRFRPWSGGPYGGAMVYTLDDGTVCRVERDFEKGIVQLFDGSFNDLTGSFDIGRDKQPTFAERQLGMDEGTFERTVFVRQTEVRLDQDGTAALAAKLANANSTGNEEISFSMAERALTEALKNNVGTARTTTQPLDRLEEGLRQLREKQGLLERQQQQRLSIQEDWQEVRNRSDRLKKELRYLEHIGSLIDIRKELDASLKMEAGLKEMLKSLKGIETASGGTEADIELDVTAKPATDGEARVLRRRRSDRRTRFSRTIPFYLPAAFAFAVLLETAAFMLRNTSAWQSILFGTLGLLTASAAVILTLNKTRRNTDTIYGQEELPNIREHSEEWKAFAGNICASASLLYGSRLNSADDIRKALGETAEKLDELSTMLDKGIAAAKGMGCWANGAFPADELDTVLFDADATVLDKALKAETEKTDQELLQAALREKYLEGLMEDKGGELDELQRIEEEMADTQERILELRNTGAALKLAQTVLAEAGLELKRSFAPGLNSSMSKIIAGLTAGRYTDLRGDDRLLLQTSDPESGDVKNALMLSGATADQMYLALRLAMAGLLSAGGESLPLVMDEVFSLYDDNRTSLALKYLHNTYENGQVLIFTCKQREVELARKICGNDLNLVEL